eukprot:Seg1740.7 transcript_id=Seg1740.7/GoldUCD/mRNA.D3Y31 product="Dihydrofolate reductase" protein_id=Seg1740.7/GoldUCD/D3Y31
MESMVLKPLRCVAAMDVKRGIGKNNNLPWRLRNEMNYFTKITTTVKNPGMKNVALMGRKTWESIPPKYKPLANRINVVLSKTLNNVPDGVIVMPCLDDAVQHISKTLANEVETIFVVGGAGVYEETIKSKFCDRIYLTHVMEEFDCDTFFPEFDEQIFKRVSDEQVPEGIQEEKGIKFEFRLYERKLTS